MQTSNSRSTVSGLVDRMVEQFGNWFDSIPESTWFNVRMMTTAVFVVLALFPLVFGILSATTVYDHTWQNTARMYAENHAFGAMFVLMGWGVLVTVVGSLVQDDYHWFGTLLMGTLASYGIPLVMMFGLAFIISDSEVSTFIMSVLFIPALPIIVVASIVMFVRFVRAEYVGETIALNYALRFRRIYGEELAYVGSVRNVLGIHFVRFGGHEVEVINKMLNREPIGEDAVL